MRAWAVCGVLLLATFLNYMDRQALSVNLAQLRANYALDEARIGVIEGCFGLAFAAGSILFGLLADRFGPRVLYPLVVVGWSAAGIATSFAADTTLTATLETTTDPSGTGFYRYLLACRILLGVFEAGHWPCALITVRQLLSTENRTLGNGVLQSGASLGAIVVPFYVQWTEAAGKPWPFTFWSIGLIGVLWVPIWFLLARKRDFATIVGSIKSTTDRPLSATLWRQLLALAIVIGTLNISWQFLRAWLPLYLETNRNFSRDRTLNMVAFYFIAADVGCILSGVLVRWLVPRTRSVLTARLLGYTAFVGLTAAAALIPLAPSDTVAVVLLLLAGAGILGLHPYYYSFAQDLPPARMGLLSGVLAAFGWIVASIFQFFIGANIRDTQSYDTGLVVAGVLPALGLVSLLLLMRRTPRG